MIALLLPTRNKPEELRRIIKEVEQTSTKARILCYIAWDDPRIKEYEEIFNELSPLVAHGFLGPQLGFSGATNYLAEVASRGKEYSILMRCEDDFYFEREGWDEAYIKAMPKDGIGMVWCNYVLKGPNAEPHTAAVGMNWYKALGYFSLPGVLHYFCDNALLDLAKAVDRAFYIDTPFINHKYVAKDPRKHDPESVTKTNNIWEHDSPVYKLWKEGEGFRSDVKKLNDAKA